MIRYLIKNLKSILFILVLLSSFISSCGNNSSESEELKNLTNNDNSVISSSSDATGATTQSSTSSVECDTNIYGDACSNLENFVLVKKDELKPEYIRSGASIGGVKGNLSSDTGNYNACSL